MTISRSINTTNQYIKVAKVKAENFLIEKLIIVQENINQTIKSNQTYLVYHLNSENYKTFNNMFFTTQLVSKVVPKHSLKLFS